MNRFHKTATLLAEVVSGIESNRLETFPLLVCKGENVGLVKFGYPGGDDDYVTPYVINASFCLEHCLKIIKWYYDGIWLKGHNLVKLYRALPDSVRTDVAKNFEMTIQSKNLYNTIERLIHDSGFKGFRWNVDELLASSGNAFDDWRYAFDNEGELSWFAGYYEIYNELKKEIEKIVASREG